ncbi:ARM repeat-containing protein [Ramicandelaber brevisporus]|nr:ARM repeat-containing protein [Ramicandelaber brevisporus]KAI8868202.1 ARM repeat-containing protein [Ramicandelaber brevisporus]
MPGIHAGGPAQAVFGQPMGGGGGGGGRGGRGRGRGGGYGHTGNRHQQHQHQQQPQQDEQKKKLTDLIVKVGDKAPPTMNQIESLATVLQQGLGRYREAILSMIAGCAVDLPAKATVYAALVGVMNAKSHETGVIVVERVNASFSSAMSSGDWHTVKLLVRFYGLLVSTSVITPSAYMSFLGAFVAPLRNDGPRTAMRDRLAGVVISALIWSIDRLVEDEPELVNMYAEVVGAYIESRKQFLADLRCITAPLYIDPSRPGNHGRSDPLTGLWQAFSTLRDSSEVFVPFFAGFEWFNEEAVKDAEPCELPSPDLPAVDNLSCPEPMFMSPFNLIAQQTAATSEGGAVNTDMHRAIRVVVQDVISDMMDGFEVNRRECGKFLGLTNNLFTAMTFPPSSLIDDAANSVTANGTEGVTTFSHQYAQWVAEVMFGKLLRLPSTPHREMFYASLAVEMLKTNEAFSWEMTTLMGFLFDNLPRLDTECITRLVSWFGYQLSVIQYSWGWADWLPGWQNQLPVNVRVVFGREILYKCIRLSYYDRVKAAVPENLHPLIMPYPAPEHTFFYNRQNNQTVPFAADPNARALLESLAAQVKARAGATEIMECVRGIIDNVSQVTLLMRLSAPVYADPFITSSASASAAESGVIEDSSADHHGANAAIVMSSMLGSQVTDPNERTLLLQRRLVRDILMQHFCMLGRKSFTHLLNMLERNQTVIKDLTTRSPQLEQLHLLGIVESFWFTNPQFLAIVIDKLIFYGIVSPTVVIDWIFSGIPDNVYQQQSNEAATEYKAHQRPIAQYSAFYLWEILHQTVGKTIARVNAPVPMTIDNEDDTTAMDTSIDDAETAAADLTSILILSTKRLVGLLETLMAADNEMSAELGSGISTDQNEKVEATIRPDIIKWVRGRYVEFVRRYAVQLSPLTEVIERELFSDMGVETSTIVDPSIKQVFDQLPVIASI